MKKPRNSSLVIITVLLCIIVALAVLHFAQSVQAQARSEVHAVWVRPNAYTPAKQVRFEWVSAYNTVCIYKEPANTFLQCFTAPIRAIALPELPADTAYVLHTGDVVRFEFLHNSSYRPAEVLYVTVPEAVYISILPIVVKS